MTSTCLSRAGRQQCTSPTTGVLAPLLCPRVGVWPGIHIDSDRLRLIARVVVDHGDVAFDRIVVLSVVGVDIDNGQIEAACVDIFGKRRRLLQIAVRVEMEMHATSNLALVHTFARDRATDTPGRLYFVIQKISVIRDRYDSVRRH